MSAPGRAVIDQVHSELWISLASLLRSYTAAHGLHGDRHATVEVGNETIIVRYGEKWLSLVRDRAMVSWTRENGSSGSMELTESGRLQSETDAEEMDMVAEAWARELMQ